MILNLLLSSIALGQDFYDYLDSSKMALKKKEYDKVKEYVYKAEKAAANSKRILLPEDISAIWLFYGIAEVGLNRDPNPYWRKAITLNPTLHVTEKLVFDKIIECPGRFGKVEDT